jgi:hypothetical protein
MAMDEPGMESLWRAVRGPSIDNRERELKFTAPVSALAALRVSVASACRSDADFPHGIVWSLYFDTIGLQFLREKIDSDYFKTKVRVRWYADPDTPRSGGPAVIEIKRRQGDRRQKDRIPLGVSGTDLLMSEFAHAALLDLAGRLRADGVHLPVPLVPIMTIRYERHRFIEPASGSRVALDSDIRVVAVNPRALRPARPTSLPLGVLEVKGPGTSLPPALHSTTALGARRRSFSKYWACYQQALTATI